MNIKKAYSFLVLPLIVVGSTFAEEGIQKTYNSETDLPTTNKADLKNRLEIIQELDIESMTTEEKTSLIQELIDSNDQSLKLVPNKEINLEGYRNEVGSHSHSYR